MYVKTLAVPRYLSESIYNCHIIIIYILSKLNKATPPYALCLFWIFIQLLNMVRLEVIIIFPSSFGSANS